MTVPIGTIMAYCGEVQGNDAGKLANEDWLVCAGQEVSRGEYGKLYEVIGDFFGIGDGVSTFNVPDLRGRFLRGVDHGQGRDPDAKTRKASGKDGSTGDHVGTYQDDAMLRHYHALWVSEQSYKVEEGEVSVYINVGQRDMGETTGCGTAYETRPRNLYVNWIIYGGE